MPDFKSAYYFQQRDDLTRHRVIELAEIGPSFWKLRDEELNRPDVKNGYYNDGFSHLKNNALKTWSAFANCNRNVKIRLNMMKQYSLENWDDGLPLTLNQLNGWLNLQFNEEKQRFDEYDDLIDNECYSGPLEEEVDIPRISLKKMIVRDQQRFFMIFLQQKLLYILPQNIKASWALELLAKNSSDIHLKNVGMDCKMEEVLNKMKINQLLELFKVPRGTKNSEEIWKYLQYGTPVFLNVFFSTYLCRTAFF